MKRSIVILCVFGLLVLSISNILLWLDNKQQWNMLNTQVQMLSRVWLILSQRPFMYEDEIPGNNFIPFEDI